MARKPYSIVFTVTRDVRVKVVSKFSRLTEVASYVASRLLDETVVHDDGFAGVYGKYVFEGFTWADLGGAEAALARE